MKLNLLPTYVSKEQSAKAAWVFSVLFALAGIAAAVFMFTKSRQDLVDATTEAASHRTKAAEAVQISKDADSIMNQARPIIVNIDLANAMMQHNAKYAALYDEVRRYIPSFFRLTAIQASPSGPEGCVVTMTGVVHTYQEYADLMLALMRIPGATGVSRGGYQIYDKVVPPLNETDNTGRPVNPGEPNIPDDPMERLEYLMSRGEAPRFTGVGGFGTDDIAAKGAMPEWSLVTVSVVLPRNIQTPDPRATLAAASSGSSAPAGGVPGAGGGFNPPSGGGVGSPSAAGVSGGGGPKPGPGAGAGGRADEE